MSEEKKKLKSIGESKMNMRALYLATQQPSTQPLNQPSPVVSPLTSAPPAEPSSAPASESVSAPIGQPVNRSAGPPITESISSPVTGLISAPTTGQASPPAHRVTLDSTHTNSEKAVYSILYRETISFGRNDIYFRMRDLLRETGIRSKQTVRTAVHGLESKLSIDFRFREGDVYGGVYHVYGPKEIFAARKAAGIEIDPTSKRIKSRRVSGPVTESASPLISDEDGYHEIQSASPPEISPHVFNTKNNPTVHPPSSGPSDRDDKLAKVRKLFEQLSNGGTWKDDRDLKAYEQIAQVNLFHITLGLCYSVTKSPEHKMSSLAYAVNSILKHAEDMSEYPDTVLGEISYKTKRTTMNCIATGKWLIPDWEKEV